MKNPPATYAKAVAAAGIGFATAFLAALLPYLDGGLGAVTATGWVTAALAGLVSLGASFGVVYRVPNQAPPN